MHFYWEYKENSAAYIVHLLCVTTIVFFILQCVSFLTEVHRATAADYRLSASQSACQQESSGRSVTSTLTAPPVKEALHHSTPAGEQWRFSRNLNNFPLIKWHNSRVEGFVLSDGFYSLDSSVLLNLNTGNNGSALLFHAAHFEKLHFQLSKEFELDHMTGLLLIYPSCVLHIVEVSLLQMNPPESIQRLICRPVVSPTVIQRGSTSCSERPEKPPTTSKLVHCEDIAPTLDDKSVFWKKIFCK